MMPPSLTYLEGEYWEFIRRFEVQLIRRTSAIHRPANCFFRRWIPFSVRYTRLEAESPTGVLVSACLERNSDLLIRMAFLTAFKPH